MFGDLFKNKTEDIVNEKLKNITIGNRIKNIRLAKGMTLEEFGKLFNASKSSVYGWENGRNMPNKERLKMIAKIGEISVNELIGENNEPLSNLFKDFRKIDEIDFDNYIKENNSIVEYYSNGYYDIMNQYYYVFVGMATIVEKLLNNRNPEFDDKILDLGAEFFNLTLTRIEWKYLDHFVVNSFKLENININEFVLQYFTFNDFEKLYKVLISMVENRK